MCSQLTHYHGNCGRPSGSEHSQVLAEVWPGMLVFLEDRHSAYPVSCYSGNCRDSNQCGLAVHDLAVYRKVCSFSSPIADEGNKRETCQGLVGIV